MTSTYNHVEFTTSSLKQVEVHEIVSRIMNHKLNNFYLEIHDIISARWIPVRVELQELCILSYLQTLFALVVIVFFFHEALEMKISSAFCTLSAHFCALLLIFVVHFIFT